MFRQARTVAAVVLAALGTLTIGCNSSQESKELDGQKQTANSSPATAVNRHSPRVASGDNKPITNSIGMKLVLIPPGEFLMGSSKAEIKAWNNWFERKGIKGVTVNHEGPQHRVRITQPFYMGTCAVTIGQFRKFVEDSSYVTAAEKAHEKSTWRKPILSEQTDEHPVVEVNWNDAAAFCEWLSRKEGQTYRLPTEAEWEYACRAGSTKRYCFGDDEEEKEIGNYAWYSKNSDLGTHPVGRKHPNAFGLYDMNGNVWQWCADWYGADYYAASPTDDPQGPESGVSRVLRGGGWSADASVCCSAFRGLRTPGFQINFLGFRVARVAAVK